MKRVLEEEIILAVIGAELNISKHKSWSWFIKLDKILLVLCSKTG